ncbi:MAG TPA: T9SS type A sorting domain-containing protein [Prolixibacteraceae bacterium]|nr:T9SS type A sorting domain-containing protein [Prolixibacteraceae bacterium]
MRCDSTTNYPVGVELFARQHLFQLYPNPATHEISVEFDEWQDSDNPVALLYDVIGNLKIETTIHACKTAIDLSGLFPGSYILIIKANKGVIDYEKFIKN